MDTEDSNKHRSNMDAVIRCSNATPLGRFGDTGFKCCYCDEEYREPPDLKSHTLETHSITQRTTVFKKLTTDRFFIKVDITGLQCTICEQNPDTIEDLLEHFKTFHQKKVYTEIDNHIIPFKFATEILQCFLCLRTFSKFRMLQEHMHVHYRNYVCDVCDLGYFNFHSLKNHKLSHNTGTFKCDQCSQVFETKMRRAVHEKRKHGGTPIIFKCGYCSEIFNNFRKKEAHLISVHDVKVPTPKCESCDKVFPDRDKLYKHVKRVHHKEKPHKCSECGRSFCSTAELRSHMASHTGARLFKCTICGKAFARAKTLRQHAKIHDVVKKYNCEPCRQAFVQRCSWKIHMKSKHGETV